MCKPLVMALGFRYNGRPYWVRQPLSGVQPMGAPARRLASEHCTKTNASGRNSDGVSCVKELGKMPPYVRNKAGRSGRAQP